ncbi:hypothetical protein HZS55_02885 [Halosimplex rubrum]|uniref:STAS/SEC14 domain-containing protein n=1 Tax=Halosimplex rubrum TaxID=869889 RepID=A0A7D5SW50_9EURY|nr:hypothetical protein [Halosimplex rubrum]QLH76311.1 hypothetical protein HZS55_02885 [Halosimplex rubrum]
MPRQVAADTEKYTIEIDENIDAIIHTWDDFAAGQAFRDGCNELLDVVRRNDKSKMIIDTSGIQAHDDADKEWLQEEWIPKVIEAGIGYSVTVTSDSVISEMEMEEFVDQTQDHPYTNVMAGDMGEAREWIDEQ